MAEQPAHEGEAPRDAKNRKRDVVTEFIEDYSAALQEARESATLTATVRWQALYHATFERDRRIRHAQAESLRAFALTLEDHGCIEDFHKELGQLRNAIQAQSDAMQAFMESTVEPLKATVRELDRVAEKCIARANREEQAAPLHEAGLVDTLKAEIAKHDRATWDAEAGLVTIVKR